MRPTANQTSASPATTGQKKVFRKPVLLAGVIYEGDNGRLLCLECAGNMARFTGRDLSGHKVKAMTQEDAEGWMMVMGVDMACECGRTKHKPSPGIGYSEEAARRVFSGEDYLCVISTLTAIES